MQSWVYKPSGRMMEIPLVDDFTPSTKITPPGDLCHLSAFSDKPILQHYFNKPNRGAMKIMLFLILVSLTVAAGFLLAFLFAARNGQFDDDCTPAIRMLFDEPAATGNGEETGPVKPIE